MTRDLLSAVEIAARLRCVPDTVTRVARKHGVGRLVGRVRVYSESDAQRLARLVRAGPGCPLFVPGNTFGARKYAKKPRKTRS